MVTQDTLMSSGALPRTIVQLDHWSGLQLQLLIVAGYQPGCSTFRLLHNNATHLVLQAVSNTNTQIHKYINTNATKNTMQLLIVAGYSTFRPFHRDKTLHAALNTVQLKQCVCSLFTEQCVCCRWQALHTFRQFMLYQQSLTC